LAGIGFIHLGFLAAAAAVAVPIVIHLLFRPRAQQVKIGTLFFLRSVLRDSARRRKVRRWLLLALRAAGVLLLAILFARPYRNDFGSEGAEREAILLIDRSASMGAAGENDSPFARAQKQATKLLRDLPTDTAAHLAYFDADGIDPRPEARIDQALLPGGSGTDFGKALGWARDIVVGSRRRRREVFLWTDLQRNGLRSPLAAPFPARTRVDVIDVGRPVSRNLAVELVQAEQTDLREGRPVRVVARVFNAGVFPTRDVPVSLALEGMKPLEQTITVEGRTRRNVHFDLRLDKPALVSGFALVKGGDDLPFDDRRFFVFETRLAERVLLVDGEPGPSVFGNETYYLETALRLQVPGDDSKHGPVTPYVPERIPGDGTSFTLPDLARYRIVILCNVAVLSREHTDALSRFVDSGGTLIVMVGDRVGAGAYAALEEQKVLPGRIGEQVEAGPYRFAEWVKEHPIVAPFADPLRGDLKALRFLKIARITPAPEARVIASAQGGLPILVERSAGRGRCLLFAIPADNAWGEWAIHPLFLPLVHQVAGYATDRLPGAGRVQESQAGPCPAEAPGVTLANGRAVVRNVDSAESDVERTSVAKLREFYRLPEPVPSASPDQSRSEGLAASSERPDEFWRAIAWALLLVLVIETFIANKTYA
jgi:Aerotolerance regulator N-terminal